MIFKSIIAACFALLFAAFCFVKVLDDSDELQSKREWSLIQTTMEIHRSKNDSSRMVIEKNEELTVVGILSDDSKTRVWIMLNPQHEPWIKVLPDDDFYILSSEFELLKSQTNIDHRVLDYLQTQIQYSE